MTSGWIKVGGVALACGLVSEVVYFLYKRYRKRGWQYKGQSESESRKEIEEVLFFPDSQVACRNYFVGDHGCDNNNCRFTHIPNSLSRLYEFINSAKKSVDVCVFVICCTELADLLIELNKRNVIVRVICDDEQINITGSQIWKLRKEGINVRTDNSSYLMHHKFLIIDDSLLLNGSFNWTRQAISGNQENLMALNNARIVSLYKAEYKKLWEKFDPRNTSPS